MPFPIGITRAAPDLAAKVTLTEPTILAAGSRQAPQLAMLVHCLAEPVDSRVTPDDLVLGVDHDNLKELVDRVLPNPVGVEDT